ncbi:hypothetical protein [Actinoplanes friuliensis]|uniref:RING-type E3 ubiquitin transferase n=1 Tax=Actinoplanes friuliensis DSM 7358 TaxID=1246995 RepID=U5W6I6_9ACTN|nr:hypothetical protein [Actinoplanes friuliensis]AGZ44764.1 hypothetical protein AFR_32530 [Actinoplanes friuliensis DSM 7358]
MATFAALVLGLGICLLVVAGLVQLLMLGDLHAVRTIRRTTPSPAASWRAGTGRIAAEGIVDDGPAGPQSGPLSAARCSWYRVRLVREPSRSWSDEVHEDVLLDFSSPAPPTFSDHSGRVVLDPRLFEDTSGPEPRVTETTTVVHRSAAPADLPPFVPRPQIDDLRRGEKLTLTETRIPYAREVYALALPAGEPLLLMPNPQGLTVFTTDTREQVLAARRDSIATARWMTRIFVLAGLALIVISSAALWTFF